MRNVFRNVFRGGRGRVSVLWIRISGNPTFTEMGGVADGSTIGVAGF